MIDYTYKSDSQIVMLALVEVLNPGYTGGVKLIMQELLKRGLEQKMHIPYYIRQKRGEKV